MHVVMHIIIKREGKNSCPSFPRQNIGFVLNPMVWFGIKTTLRVLTN